MTTEEAIKRVELMRRQYPLLSVVDAEALDIALSSLRIVADTEKNLPEELGPFLVPPNKTECE